MPPAPSAAAIVIQIRLWSGIVLFTYLTTHFLNHALGLVSLDAMTAGRDWFVLLWRSWPGTVALYGSFASHNALALWALYRKRTLRMPAWEAVQLTLGLLVPPLLVWHVVGTRSRTSWPAPRTPTPSWCSTSGSSTRWRAFGRPSSSCRLGPRLHRDAFLAEAAPVVSPVRPDDLQRVPALAGAGAARVRHRGQEVSRLAREPGFVQSVISDARLPDPVRRAMLRQIAHSICWGDLTAIGLVLVARAGREHLRRRQGVRVGYPGGREVLVPAGFTVLEASRYAGIPHASVCGGRGRCSTCRVRVMRGADHLPAATVDELRVLGRVGAPVHVRLACQVRPLRDLAVVPLVPAEAGPRDAVGVADHREGQELTIAVLFADLRGFTRLAERKLRTTSSSS